MHPDLVTEFYRHHFLELERDARIKRLLGETRPRRHPLRNILEAVQGLRRRRPPRTVAATARPCR